MKLRLTKKRQAILDVLKSSSEALSAKAISSHLPHVDLVTIYRNLDLFVKSDLITALHFDSAEVTYEFQKQPHHHAICDVCHKVIHFTNDSALADTLQLTNFTPTKLELTVRGTCDRHN